jgi:hypothetical protein
MLCSSIQYSSGRRLGSPDLGGDSGFRLINLDTSQVIVHGGLRGRLSTQRQMYSAKRFLEKNSAYLSPEAIACFEDLNIRRPEGNRLQYISMILSRLARDQVSKVGHSVVCSWLWAFGGLPTDIYDISTIDFS